MSGSGTGSPRRVHQLLAALSYGDAISNEALAIQGHLRAAGFASDIFAEKVHPRMAHLARPLWDYRAESSPETVCLFHFSIGSAAGRMAFHAPDRLVAIYHNITPAEFFLGFHPHLAGLCHHGRRELEAFAPRTSLALGDSEYNRRELEAAGFERTGVLPIVLDLPKYDRPASAVVRRLYDDERTNILFVGRIIPNKKIEDLVRTFAAYQRWVEPRSRLLLVGDTRGFVKIVTERRYDEVLGIHIIGPHATELISEATAALNLEATAESLFHAVHAHPTLAEAIGEAALAVHGRAIHF